jgi:hypothetical protein
MLVVLPVSHVDLDQAETLLNHCISHEDSSHEFSCLLVLSSTLREDEPRLGALAARAFRDVDVLLMEKEVGGGWPVAPNFMFKQTVSYLEREQNTTPWFWLEADNIPTRRSWLKEIYTEYNLSGKRFSGAFEKTRLANAQTGEFAGFDGEHLNGSAVYPGDFYRRSLLWKHLTTVAWDIYMKWEMIPHAHRSELMVSRWRSCNYRRVPGGYAFDQDYRHTPQDIVPETAAVVHGCKDDSLFRLLWEKAPVVEQKPQRTPRKVQVTPEIPVGASVVLEED